MEASTDSRVKDAQLTYKSFYPKMEGIVEKAGLGVDDAGKTGEITFPIATPAGMTSLRIFTFYRARDKADGWDVQASFDSGKTWRDVGRCEGSAVFASRYFTVDDIPAGTKWALVRWSGQQRNATRITNFRIDADYPQPNGGVRPVKVTYVWEEDGHEKKDEHVARSADETYKIICGEKPTMKSLTVELAK